MTRKYECRVEPRDTITTEEQPPRDDLPAAVLVAVTVEGEEHHLFLDPRDADALANDVLRAASDARDARNGELT